MRSMLILLSLVGAAPAQALDVVRCSLDKTPHGWVAQSLVLAHEPGAAHAILADDIGFRFADGAVDADVTAEAAGVLRFTWSRPRLTDPDGNLVPAMVYRAELDKNASSLRISANPVGYSARFSGKGHCLLVPEAERRAMADLVSDGG